MVPTPYTHLQDRQERLQAARDRKQTRDDKLRQGWVYGVAGSALGLEGVILDRQSLGALNTLIGSWLDSKSVLSAIQSSL
eukprot:143280-Pelagomonas_calceolata.AAC.3